MPRDRSRERHRSSHSSRKRSASPEESRKSRRRERERSSSSRSHRKEKSRKHHRRHKNTDDGSADEGKAKSGTKYTDAENPFNDEALGKKFVWKKKVEQDRARGLSKEEMRAAERRRREEADLELESLRKRRELREAERAQRDEEMKRIRREQEQEKLGDWERREEEFHLQQAKKRAEIRIRNGRPKPIDILAMNLRLANEQLEPEDIDALGTMRIDVDEPHRIVDGLGENECEELLHDVEMYLALESNAQNVEFWENMLTVCACQLQEMRDTRINSGDSTTRRAGSEITQEVKDVLAEKSLEELMQLETEVVDRLSGRSGAVDVDYWEQVRSQLGVAKARATLTDMHQAILERRLERLREALKKQRGEQDANPGQEEGTSGPSARETASETEQRKRRRLEELQRRILEEQHVPGTEVPDQGDAEDHGTSAEIERKMYETELNKEHDPSEAVFSVEASVPTKHYSWQDKHRPRKPRYFNRVHTGYEWNKYNQTHYDKDNPPPKVVQGYKFNIFYPDLINRSNAPTYRVEKDPGGGDDTVVLRFTAGPPYEDIAFRVVNREWEYNRRRGFRNIFDRGVLQLYFRFKRHYYRR
ncbi:hypothetical protein IW140_005133 [Coemansia sp. RSA 1813]|nr:hypothetical protein EV178_005934 [Coemansia sp. RSA 1646]KAJ1767485.1 hypothetical protein LPJ74_005352 [Coemansia sp. RSA 1843]KAJ2087184.1 hypothetical protein IW138_005171 [Coemansia sp. RSA 986]KAJ2211975.1 hypothetical protein EV179_005019 [Coemansia sp. RSA 487]KAJ2565978.1 hypothetical protein IW140_005133 [Coemansia sp. RSA 1813]